MVRRAAQTLILTLSIAAPAAAQLPPVRLLGPIVATAADALGSVPSVRALSDGRVLVSDLTRRRLVLLDTALAHPVVVLAPSGAAAPGFPARGGTLPPLAGGPAVGPAAAHPVVRAGEGRR